MTHTFAAPIGQGRHRRGHPGLVPVTAFVNVIRRGFLTALFRPGKHRFVSPTPVAVPTRQPAHAI